MSFEKYELTNKHILLDTCFIIKSYQYFNTPFFNDLFRILEENQCTPVINEFIKFEFMRGCQKKEHIDIKADYLRKLSKLTLPITQDALAEAAIISNIYSNKNVNNNQIGITDICNSTYLKKYKDLFLLTLDNSDYPLIIHDRTNIETIDTEKEILLLGFYKFNNDKFAKAKQDLFK